MDESQRALAIHMLDCAESVLEWIQEQKMATPHQIASGEASVGRMRDFIEGGQYGSAMHEAFFAGILCGELGLYSGDLEYDAERKHVVAIGTSSKQGGKLGHQKAYGTDADKQAAWTEQFKSYQRHLETGRGKMVAMRRAAKELDVSIESIRRARKRFE